MRPRSGEGISSGRYSRTRISFSRCTLQRFRRSVPALALYLLWASAAGAGDPLAVLGEAQKFSFQVGGAEVAVLDCRYSRAQGGNYSVESDLSFDYGKMTPGGPKLEMTSRLVVDGSAAPQSYRLSARVGAEIQQATCDRVGDRWKCQATARGQTLDKEFPIDPAAPFVVLDNNMIGHWALYLALARPPAGASRELSAFVPQSLSQQRFQLAPLSPDADGNPRLSVQPIQETFICNKSGKLLRIEEPRQNLVIIDVAERKASH
ncbi:hypothetical protein HS125_06950 [bacterium]|nr:hypothetical protein [bacterium]